MRRHSVLKKVGIGLLAFGVIAAPLSGVVAATPAAAADTVVLESSFQTESAPWRNRGPATIALTDQGHESSSSLLVSGRVANWQGVEVDVKDRFTAGKTYDVSGWVKLAAGESATAMKFTVAEAPEAYTQVSTPVTVTADAWVKLTGTYTMPAGLTAAALYVEAAGASTSYLVDDVAITTEAVSATAEVLSSTFQTVSTPWRNRGPATIALTNQGHESSSSLLVSGRVANWQGVEVDVKDLFTASTTYNVSGWVKLAAGESATAMKFTVAEAPEAYTQVSTPVTVTADAWVKLTGTYTMPAGLTAAALYVEAAGATTSYLVDDVLITGPSTGGPVTPQPTLGLDNDFETALTPWAVRGSGEATASLSTTQSHGGTKAALVTNRTNNWNGLGASVTGLFLPARTYTISGWVRLADGVTSASDVRVSVQRDNGGTSTYDSVTTVTGVTSSGWTNVSANYTMTSADSALLYFETVAGTSSFLVDDVTVAPATALPIQTDIPSLKDELPWPVGVAIDERETVGSSADLIEKHFSQITAENYMKPEAIQPTEGVFTFDAADQLVEYAAEKDLRVWGHTLVWHSQTPAWFFQKPGTTEPLTTSPADKQLLRDRMKTHIDTVADHYRDIYGEYGTAGNPFVGFDVVNEAIAESEDDGLRRSEWLRILGPDYLKLAFDYASDAFNGGDTTDPAVKLFINDYNTEFPAKRQALFNVVEDMIEDGAPVDGVGHQFHLTLGGSIAQMKASIDKFNELGLLQDVSELDVQIPGTLTQDRLIEQGYYYEQIFDMLREYDDLFSVTIWGPYDARSWRTGAPLLFNDSLQAKPAFFGIVDPDELPTLTKQANVQEADIEVNAGSVDAEEWKRRPLTAITTDDSEATATGFQVRWSEDGLVAYVKVADATDDGDDDTVTLFAGSTSLEIGRNGTTDGTAAVRSNADGYVVVAELPLADLANGADVAFDVRVTDGDDNGKVSWNDQSNTQAEASNLGNLALIDALAFVEVPELAAAPTIDGEIDAAWADVPVVQTTKQVEGTPGATADVRTVWSGDAVNFLVEVTDSQLNDGSSNAWEQDSVEIFVDPSNAKAGLYRIDDGQYRINYKNVKSISGDLEIIGQRLTSATTLTDDGYIVEASVKLGAEVEPGSFVGLDFQVNDGNNGARTSVRSWSDPTGQSYQTTSRWGVGQLLAAATDPGEEPPVDEPPVEEPPVDEPVIDDVFTTVPRPAILGEARVGLTVTANPGTWVPAADSYRYEWKSNGAVVGTGASYVVAPGDLGRTLTVTVTGSRAGFADATSETSLASSEVLDTGLTSAVPTITGSAKIGGVLTANPGTWGPGTVALSYQWYLDGAKLAETSPTLTVPASAVNRFVYVTVTGSKAGYANVTTGSLAVRPVSGTFVRSTPTVSGGFEVGSKVTAKHGGWSPTSGTDFEYQWYSQSTPTSTPVAIRNADNSTFRIPASLRGDYLLVKVTASRPGYVSAIKKSTPEKVLGKLAAAKPKVSGTEKVGRVLTVKAGSWSPKKVKLTYSWIRVSKGVSTVIRGADEKRYTLKAADRGATIQVEVTGKLGGYESRSVVSAKSSKVK